MKIATKICLIWLGVVSAGLLLLEILPNRRMELTITGVNQAVMALIALVSFFIFRNEPNKNNAPIFLNFTLLFAATSFSFIHYFVGKAFFTNFPFASFYFYQYVVCGLFFFILALAVLYVVIDTLFNDIRTVAKYAITLLIVGGVFTYYYYPMLENPKYLYTTEDILDFKSVTAASDQLAKQGIANPTAEELAAIVHLPAWKDGQPVGTLFPDQKIIRVAELLPYLEGNNYLTLLTKPLHLNVIYMNVLCIIFIFLFFGYQYKNDPPQGAYIEKIIFLFLPFCSLEIVHFFGYIKSVEHAAYLDYYHVGQYVSLLNLVALLIFFSLRLRFITSVKGEFYERELVSDSERISRWRDGLDNLLVRHFLNPKTFQGRLFAPRTPRDKT